jgi:phosphoglycolate phosphatase
MLYRAVLFDIDGTLLDTLKDIADSSNRVLARSGFPQHGLEAYKYFVGDGVETLAVRILPENHRDEKTVVGIVEEINNEYYKHWADTTRPYDGIPELLNELTARGLKMAVLSNKSEYTARLTVSRLLPGWHFEAVLGISLSIPKKPDPSGALKISRSLQINTDEFLYVGDTNTDMMTAGAAGMYGVGALWGFRTADELLASGARELLERPLDLLNIINRDG